MATKLWEKSTQVNAKIEAFTVGRDREMDVFLAKYDVLGSMAHIRMLESVGLLHSEELSTLLKELRSIYDLAENGQFIIEEGVEDVHSQVELMLTRSLGDMGKKVHSGRSRNDQVLLDLKLFMRQKIKELTMEIKELFDLLIELSEKHKAVLMPGYTHFQVAMPSSFGIWFGAYAESLSDDMIMLQAAHRIVNQNPLGSAAGYGSSFPLNRQMTSDLLGFEQLSYNVAYAQMGRGKAEKLVACGMASVGSTLAKMAMDVCLYMSQNFGFVSFPNHLTTGSSIMPHKKNPDVFELVRAKGNKLQALPTEISLITNNLPMGYHRDLQLIKENFIPAFDELTDCIRITHLMLSNIQINSHIIENEMYKYIFSVEEVNKLVLAGVPFRDAYKKIGIDIELQQFEPSKEVNHTHEGSIGNLCNHLIVNKMNKVISEFDFQKTEQAFVNLLT